MAKLFICGDIANMSSQKNFIGEDIAKLIKSADYSIGNLEGPEKTKNMSLNCPAQLSGTIKHLRDSGFNMMLLANNEISSDDVKFTCFDHMKGIKLEVGQILVVEDGYAQFDDVLMLEAKTVLPDGNYMITEIVSTENNRYVVKVSEI